MQLKSVIQLADGVYFREHIYAIDAPARVLQEYLPLNDERYLGVMVKGGSVAEILMQEPGSALSRPKIPMRTISSWEEVDNRQIASLSPKKEAAPMVNFERASIAELRALAVANSIDPAQPKAKLVDALKATEVK